jgi:hypothetical protein
MALRGPLRAGPGPGSGTLSGPMFSAIVCPLTVIDCTSTTVFPRGVTCANPETAILAPGRTTEMSLAPNGGVRAMIPFWNTNPFTSPCRPCRELALWVVRAKRFCRSPSGSGGRRAASPKPDRLVKTPEPVTGSFGLAVVPICNAQSGGKATRVLRFTRNPSTRPSGP